MAPIPTPPPTSPATTQTPTLTLTGAQTALAAATSHSHSISVPMNIAIVDSTLHLLAFARLPNAKLTSIDIAISKAFTAAGHKVPTHTYKEAVWPGGAAYGINLSNGGRFSVIGGGVPVRDREGNVVGAVGCSTGTPGQDRECAEAGVRAVERVIWGEGGVKAKL